MARKEARSPRHLHLFCCVCFSLIRACWLLLTALFHRTYMPIEEQKANKITKFIRRAFDLSAALKAVEDDAFWKQVSRCFDADPEEKLNDAGIARRKALVSTKFELVGP